MRYIIASVKQSEVFEGTLDAAKARAREIEEECQPAYGVYIADPEVDGVSEFMGIEEDSIVWVSSDEVKS